jgi:AraC-like DNA-binding protein
MLQRFRLREKFSKEPFIEPAELTSNSMNSQFLTKAIKIVEDNIFNPDFDSQQFINEMAMSKTQLYRKLTSLIGQSATEFIRTIKLKKAARIIARREMTISEITYQMGFTDPSYFTKVFKKQFGMLPSSYAEHYAEQVSSNE